MSTFRIVLTFIGLLITTALGDYSSKRYVLSQDPVPLLWLIVAYNFGIFFWLLLLRSMGDLARAGFLWGMGATIVLLLISQVVFHEPLTVKQWFGVVLGFVALSLIL